MPDSRPSDPAYAFLMLCLPHMGVRAFQTLVSSAILFAAAMREELRRESA